MERCVFVGVPTYGQLDQEVVLNAIMLGGNPAIAGCPAEIQMAKGSLLANVFNRLWVTALADKKYTHFAMCHADVAPEPTWLAKLLAILDREHADLVSTIIPIKSPHGHTSTAIGTPGEPWGFKHRFTMREVMDLPLTFDAAAAGYPGGVLLVNTGCWLADLRNPKFRELDGDGCLKMFFTIRDRVRVGVPDIVPEVEPEDWFFSRRAAEAGLKVLATRELAVQHIGTIGYTNVAAWGTE